MTATAHPVVTLRQAQSEDSVALRRLAELDSAAVPAGDVLLVEVDGIARAALQTSTGAVVADPFHRTARLVELLRAVAAEEAPAPQRRRGIAESLRAPAAAAHAPRLAGA